MKMVDFPIVGSYNNQRVTSIDPERSVNLFQYIDPLGKKPHSLLSTSGLKDTHISFLGAINGFRGQFVFNNDMYVVIGDSVFLINSTLSPVFLGNISTNTGYVGIDANQATHPQIIFVDGIRGYIYDTVASTFLQITDTSFPVTAIDVCYLDGFFVVANGNTNQFQLSQINNGMVWGGSGQPDTFTASSITNLLTLVSTANYATGNQITFSTSGTLPAPLNSTDTYFAINISPTTIEVAATYQDAFSNTPIILTTDGTPTNMVSLIGELQLGAITSHPGNIVACRTLHRRLFLFSLNYTEVWEDAGIGTNLPFRRNNSFLIEHGTPAIGSIVVGFDLMFFLSQDKDGLGSVMQVSGTQPIPISTRALDFQLAEYASGPGVSDCRGILIKENGIIFYRMNFTAANHTFVYDATISDPQNEESKLWHEEEILNHDRHPAQTHGYFNGINYYGHYALPILYSSSPSFSTNDGEPIRRMRISRPQTMPGYQRIRIDRFQLDLLQGNVSLLIPDASDIDLLTEDLFPIQCEDGVPILLEQSDITTDAEQPVVFLSISKDSGQTFGYLIKMPMGKVGQRTFRTTWRKLGTIPRGQSFVGKIEFFDEIPFIILGAAWSYEKMPE